MGAQRVRSQSWQVLRSHPYQRKCLLLSENTLNQLLILPNAQNTRIVISFSWEDPRKWIWEVISTVSSFVWNSTVLFMCFKYVSKWPKHKDTYLTILVPYNPPRWTVKFSSIFLLRGSALVKCAKWKAACLSSFMKPLQTLSGLFLESLKSG